MGAFIFIYFRAAPPRKVDLTVVPLTPDVCSVSCSVEAVAPRPRITIEWKLW